MQNIESHYIFVDITSKVNETAINDPEMGAFGL